MKWKFWEREKEHPLNADIDELRQQSEQLQEQISSIENQVQKLTRLQYKTGKTMEEKLAGIAETMERKEEESSNSNMTVIQKLIQQVDDMDMVNAQLKNDPNWQELIKQWLERLLHTLTDLGVQECITNGEMFDPKRAEAIETIPPSEHLARPYQIVEIHQRGFADKHETIIRKAQVTTIKEMSQ